MRFHTDKVALSYSFYDVISANEDAPKVLRELRHRCLNPGLYVQHLERWLTYYKPKQVGPHTVHTQSTHSPHTATVNPLLLAAATITVVCSQNEDENAKVGVRL